MWKCVTNTIKLNTKICKKNYIAQLTDFIPRMHDRACTEKSLNIIHNINRIIKQIHMMI